jgi:hypothetical protein
MNLPQQIKLLLTGAGLTNVKYGQYSNDPAEMVFIRVSGGAPTEYTHGDETYEYPRVQIICRSASFDTAWSRALTAKKVLTKTNFAVDGTWFLRAAPVDSLTSLGPDSNKRQQVSFNVQIIKEAEVE